MIVKMLTLHSAPAIMMNQIIEKYLQEMVT